MVPSMAFTLLYSLMNIFILVDCHKYPYYTTTTVTTATTSSTTEVTTPTCTTTCTTSPTTSCTSTTTEPTSCTTKTETSTVTSFTVVPTTVTTTTRIPCYVTRGHVTHCRQKRLHRERPIVIGLADDLWEAADAATVLGLEPTVGPFANDADTWSPIKIEIGHLDTRALDAGTSIMSSKVDDIDVLRITRQLPRHALGRQSASPVFVFNPDCLTLSFADYSQFISACVSSSATSTTTLTCTYTFTSTVTNGYTTFTVKRCLPTDFPFPSCPCATTTTTTGSHY